MRDNKIYSIGYGSRTIDDFISLLNQFRIEFLIDVRSQPYSKFNPKFNQSDLKFSLERNNIKYVFMGDTLGGRPADQTCYDEDGKVNYLEVKMRPFFNEGLQRLITAYRKDIPVVIMCSESNPCDCHRSKLIGMSLLDNYEEKISISHIDEKGKIKDQATVMNELNKGRNFKDLFSEFANTTSRKSYLK